MKEAGVIQMNFDEDFAGPSEWALMYRLHGIQVVPARSYDPKKPFEQWKRPFLSEWKAHQFEMVPDFTFLRWYGSDGEHYQRKNMGMVTGACSGNKCVIDLDIQKTPAAAYWWQGLLQEHNSGIEPETWQQVTGGGGRQLIFAFPEGVVIPTFKTGIGVDIRGQGGFAMLPPSRHQTGNDYDWVKGCGPHDIDVATAPLWLCDAIVALSEEHGGGTVATRERTASAGNVFNDFGQQIEDREDKMFKMIWARLIDLRRDSPIEPTEEDARDAFGVYERSVKSRIDGPGTNADKLEREGRGWSEFRKKWHSTMKKWFGDITEEAEKPREEARKEEDKARGPSGRLLLPADEFVSLFSPPSYLIDGIVQRGYLYSLTAKTGHGKTAVDMFVGQSVARGVKIQGREVEQGSVLFLAGENPDDIMARFLVLADKMGFAPGEIPFHFVNGVINIAESMPTIRAEAATIPNLRLIIVDTAAAYFQGDDGNSNTQTGDFARLLRQLTFLPGKPAVVVNCHPVKDAARDRLSPMGGSAFLNEVDGNLTLWSKDRVQTVLHWQGKIRGPEFEPITFMMDTVTSDSVVDARGRHMPSVVARLAGDDELRKSDADSETDENILMAVIDGNKPLSLSDLATKCNWLTPVGLPNKSKVQRVMNGLADDKLVYIRRNKYRLTPAGKKELHPDRDDDEGGSHAEF